MITDRLSWAYIQGLFLAAMMAASYFFEYVVKLTPCALCIVQRVVIACLILVTVGTIWRAKRGGSVRRWQIMALCLSVLGLLVAWRHIWLQQHADMLVNASCLPDIRFMLKMMPLPEVFMQLFSHGGAECSKVKWQLWGLTMPGWVAVSYVLYGLQIVNLLRVDAQSNVDNLA